MVISIGTGRKLLVCCHLTPLCLVTSRTSPCFHLQPPTNHSTIWTGSANQTEALLGKSVQSTEWPPSLLPPPRTLAVSVLAAAALHPAPTVASPDELVSTPAENNLRRLFEASQCSLQNALRPKEHSTSNREQRSLEASQCSLLGGLQLKNTPSSTAATAYLSASGRSVTLAPGACLL